MKQISFVLATALASVGAGSALAQSNNSVELYGVADAYIGSTSTYQYTGYDPVARQFIASKTSQAVVESGGLSQSRIGIRVREDLGNGLQAFVNVEQPLNLDTGTSAGAARASVVGLQSGWGRMSLGRQASSYHDLHTDFDVQADGRFSAIAGLPLSAAAMTQVQAFRVCESQGAACTGNFGFGGNRSVFNNTVAVINGNGYAARTGSFVGYQKRFNNSLRYDSPDFAGFSGSASIGFGENKTAIAKAAINSAFNLRYNNGPLALGIGYQIDQEQAPTPIILPGSLTPVGLIPAGGIVKLKNTLFAGSYDFGVARVNAGFNVAKYNLAGVRNQKEMFIGAAVPLGAVTLVGQYSRSKGNSLNDASSFAGEAQYALSKRSTVYAAFNQSKLPAYKNSVMGFGLRHVF
jgi:predicted porin